MALFGSLMPGLDDDPFYGGHRSMMQQMDQMMSAMQQPDPFMAMNRGFPGPMMPFPIQQQLVPSPQQLVPSPQSIMASQQQALMPAHQSRGVQAAVQRQHNPFAAYGMPGMNMLSMGQMGRGGDCHSFSSSSMMTMTTGPDGKPQVYQQTSSTRAAADGVKETRRTMSDSSTGMRSMAIGHHIKERSHVVEKEQNGEGDVEERQEFINMDEEDAPNFDVEFRRQIQQAPASLEYRSRYRPNSHAHHRNNTPALTSSSSRRRSRPALAITSGSSHEDRQRRRDRDERGMRGSHRYNPAN